MTSHRTELAAPTAIRWGAIIAGGVIGLGSMVLLSSFFLALGEGTGVEAVATNMHWYAFFSAVTALVLAGFFAGMLSGVRGAAAGMFHGVTVWGLVLIGTLAVGVPQAMRIFETFTDPLAEVGAGPLWATFFSLLGGLIAAAIGGILGGSMPRPGFLYAPAPAEMEIAGARPPVTGRTEAEIGQEKTTRRRS